MKDREQYNQRKPQSSPIKLGPSVSELKKMVKMKLKTPTDIKKMKKNEKKDVNIDELDGWITPEISSPLKRKSNNIPGLKKISHHHNKRTKLKIEQNKRTKKNNKKTLNIDKEDQKEEDASFCRIT